MTQINLSTIAHFNTCDNPIRNYHFYLEREPLCGLRVCPYLDYESRRSEDYLPPKEDSVFWMKRDFVRISLKIRWQIYTWVFPQNTKCKMEKFFYCAWKIRMEIRGDISWAVYNQIVGVGDVIIKVFIQRKLL